MAPRFGSTVFVAAGGAVELLAWSTARPYPRSNIRKRQESTMQPHAATMRAVEGICSRLRNQERVDPELQRFFDALRVIPMSCALLLYTDFCKLYLAAEGAGDLSALSVLGELFAVGGTELAARFRMAVLDNGRVMERLADSIEMTSEARIAKWEGEMRDHARRAAVHAEAVRQARRWSEFLHASRHENEAAFVETRMRVAQVPAQERRPWQELLLAPREELSGKPRDFWYALQVGTLTSCELRAVWHVLEGCKSLSAAVAPLCARLQLEVYASTSPAAASRATAERPDRSSAALPRLGRLRRAAFALLARGGR